MDKGTELLRVDRLKKYFATSRGMLHAVDDVSFTVAKGETLGVVGESGCGKSTLGRAILRLHEPTSGNVAFDGEDILAYGRRQMKRLRTRMQIIFQDPYASLNPRMTVSQAIEAPLLIQGVYRPTQKAELRRRVGEIMDLVGLARRFVNTYPHELDGGRRQRIGIARALVLDPTFIVCDEPVSALDVSIRAQVLNLMQDLQERLGLTYLFITHDLSVVKHLSDDIIVMYLGQLVEKAPAPRLFANPLHPYTKALLSAIPIPDPDCKMERVVLQGELASPIDPAPGCRFAKRCAYAGPECFSASPELREVESGHFVSCHFARDSRNESTREKNRSLSLLHKEDLR
jgi:peptide/nickel transport system ATP-binding protein